MHTVGPLAIQMILNSEIASKGEQVGVLVYQVELLIRLHGKENYSWWEPR